MTSFLLFADAFLDHLNAQHPSIRFTMEEEEEQKLPYLDWNVHRCQGESLRTSVYRKLTHTSSYLKFESNHPPSAKRSVISSLIKRMDNITLGEDEKRKEERLVMSELEANGYPLAEIKRVQRRLKKEGAAKAIPKPKQDDDITAIAAIPYVPGISEAVSRILAPLRIKTAMGAQQRKWSLMKSGKDLLPSESQPGVIYALGCRDCPKVYIGETGRTVKQRVKEHKDYTKKGDDHMSAVAKHVYDTGHAIHWQPRVVLRNSKTVERKVHEALTIQRIAKRNEDHLMNLDRGMELSAVWLSYPIPFVKLFSTACLNTSFWCYVDVLILAFAHWRSHLSMHRSTLARSVFDLAPRRHLEYILLNDIYNSKLSLTSTFSLMKTSVLKSKRCRISICSLVSVKLVSYIAVPE